MVSPDAAPARSRPWRPALAGVAAAVAGLGLAELAAGLFAPDAGPVLVIGALIIDLSPAWLKDLVIAVFGTADKAVLIALIGLAAAVLAALAGVLECRRPPTGRVIVMVLGSLAVFAALTRANATAIDLLPSVVATVVSAVLITVFATKFRALSVPAQEEQAAGALDRRRFLAWTGVSAGVGILAAVGGQLLQAGARAAEASRARLTLPAPEVPAPAIPAGASLDVPGLSSLITPNEDFYRIDTALQVPRIDASEWRVKVTGMVENDVELDFAELLALPLEESTTTLACVSNEVGGDLIGNATWLGYPIRKLLARAGPAADADMVLSRSQDGWTASTPLEALTDDRNAILAVGMNGVALPLEHGYPVRMVVPGLYGYVSATKWVVELKVTRFDREQAYWSTRGWSERGPIKLSSRIDVPRAGAPLSQGPVTVAGVAWAQHTGIRSVEVQVDEGDWAEATLADPISDDTWRQWKWDWDAPEGEHTLRVRATDADGLVQTSARRPVAPDGATGRDELTVQVG